MLPPVVIVQKRLEFLYRNSPTDLTYLPYYFERIATKESIEFQLKLAQNWLVLQLDFELFLWAMQQRDLRDQTSQIVAS